MERIRIYRCRTRKLWFRMGSCWVELWIRRLLGSRLVGWFIFVCLRKGMKRLECLFRVFRSWLIIGWSHLGIQLGWVILLLRMISSDKSLKHSTKPKVKSRRKWNSLKTWNSKSNLVKQSLKPSKQRSTKSWTKPEIKLVRPPSTLFLEKTRSNSWSPPAQKVTWTTSLKSWLASASKTSKESVFLSGSIVEPSRISLKTTTALSVKGSLKTRIWEVWHLMSFTSMRWEVEKELSILQLRLQRQGIFREGLSRRLKMCRWSMMEPWEIALDIFCSFCMGRMEWLLRSLKGRSSELWILITRSLELSAVLWRMIMKRRF